MGQRFFQQDELQVTKYRLNVLRHGYPSYTSLSLFYVKENDRVVQESKK